MGSTCAPAPTCVPVVPQLELLVGRQAVARELDRPQLGAEDGLGRVNVDGGLRSTGTVRVVHTPLVPVWYKEEGRECQ